MDALVTAKLADFGYADRSARTEIDDEALACLIWCMCLGKPLDLCPLGPDVRSEAVVELREIAAAASSGSAAEDGIMSANVVLEALANAADCLWRGSFGALEVK